MGRGREGGDTNHNKTASNVSSCMQSLSLGLSMFLMCTKLEYPVSNVTRLRSHSVSVSP